MIPKLLAIAKNRTDTRIYVRGDKNINYGKISINLIFNNNRNESIARQKNLTSNSFDDEITKVSIIINNLDSVLASIESGT